MNLAFSNYSSHDYVKLYPVKNNRVLFLKWLIFNKGIEHIVNIMLSVSCKIYSAHEIIVKPLRELFISNYRESHVNGKTGVILNEAIVLPSECELIEFIFISQIPFDVNLDYDIK